MLAGAAVVLSALTVVIAAWMLLSHGSGAAVLRRRQPSRLAYATLLTGPAPERVVRGVETWAYSLIRASPSLHGLAALNGVSGDAAATDDDEEDPDAAADARAAAAAVAAAAGVDVVCLVTRDVADELLVSLRRLGVRIVHIERMPVPEATSAAFRAAIGADDGSGEAAGALAQARRFSRVFDKLRVWEALADEYARVVYMDADTLVQRSLDALFAVRLRCGGDYARADAAAAADDDDDGDGPTGRACSERHVELDAPAGLCVAAVKDPLMAGFNSGVMLLRPSRPLFAAMRQLLHLPHPARWGLDDIGSEQGFLNAFFRAWASLAAGIGLEEGLDADERRIVGGALAALRREDGAPPLRAGRRRRRQACVPAWPRDTHYHALPHGCNALTGVLETPLALVERSRWLRDLYGAAPLRAVHFVPPPKPFAFDEEQAQRGAHHRAWWLMRRLVDRLLAKEEAPRHTPT